MASGKIMTKFLKDKFSAKQEQGLTDNFMRSPIISIALPL